YYLVPLVVLVLLWLYEDRGLLLRRDAVTGATRTNLFAGRSGVAVAVCVLVGSGGVYYAFFACFFLLAAGTWCAWHRRAGHVFWAGTLLAAIICLVGVLNLLPTFVYVLRHGTNAEAVRRYPLEAEAYGLKLGHLLLPTHSHRLARFHRYYVPSDGEWGIALGLVGSLGFLVLLGRLLFRRTGSPSV